MEEKKKHTKINQQDGWVNRDSIEPAYNKEPANRYFKGFASNTSVEVKDPRIIKAFLKCICLIFLLVGGFTIISGIIHKSVGTFILGIFIETITIIVTILARRDSKTLDKKYEKEEKYQKPLSRQEKIELKNSVENLFKEEIIETITEENIKQFSKKAIIFYVVVSIVVIVFLACMTNIWLTFVIAVILLLTGWLYFVLIGMIAKLLKDKK